MKHYVGVVIVAVLAGGVGWFFGLDVVPSIVVVLVIAGIGLTLRTVTLPTDKVDWPPAPPQPTEGVRREAAELSWAIRPGRAVSDRVVERVRNIAVNSLRRRNLDLDDPAHRGRIERLVGVSNYPVLTSGRDGGVSLPRLLAALSILERLGKSDPAARD